MMIRFVFSALCLAGLVFCQDAWEDNPCRGVADGKVVRIYCYGYKNCSNQKPVVVNCPYGTVLERDSLTCKPIGTGNTICGTSGTCSGTGYRPSPNCQSFYHCLYGVFASNTHIYCPGDLLFNGVECEYPYNVPEPCGTLKVTTTTP